jgi:hypothetical protein
MANEPISAAPTASSEDAKFKIDFIDPLFAVAIHIGFVEGLLHEEWLHDRYVPTQLGEFANLLLFIAGFWTIVASWVGYHKSIHAKPIIGQARFVLDILLLALYILLLVYFTKPLAVAVILTAIYMLYIAWDFYKTKEYSARYYGSTPSPNGLVYLARCLAECIIPGRYESLRSEAVTAGWTVFFAILVPYALFPAAISDTGKFFFAGVLILANSIYRYDKVSRGAWICSVPFKLLMAAMIGYLVLYHTKVLCFGS